MTYRKYSAKYAKIRSTWSRFSRFIYEMIDQMNISSTVCVCELIETFALHFAIHTWMRSQSSHVVRWGMNFSFSLFFFLLRPGTFFGVWIHSKFPFGCLTVIRACFPGGTSCCKVSMRGLANRWLHTMRDTIFVRIILTKHNLIYCICFSWLNTQIIWYDKKEPTFRHTRKFINPNETLSQRRNAGSLASTQYLRCSKN